jgi:hypothetical protein
VKQEQLIVITALQDVIFVGLNCSQYDIHIKSTSRVGFVGGCRVKSLTVKAKSLKFGDLTLSYLSATADEFVSFDGSVHISSTEPPLMKEPEIQNVMSKVSCGGNVLIKGEIICLGCSLTLSAMSVLCQADVSVGAGSLVVTVNQFFSNSANICVDNELMIGGHGQLKNSGVIESCGIYVIAVDNHYFDLMILSTGLVVALTRDFIFMRTSIRNEGLVQGFTCVDAVGAKKLTNSSSWSIISKGSCRLHFKIIEQGGELGAADQLTLIADGKMVNSGDIVVSHGDMIITCEGKASSTLAEQ